MLYDIEDHDDDEGTWIVREGDPSGASRGYRDLKVYRLAHEPGVPAPRRSLRLPKDERYETGSQLRRAAKSVSANIVEGDGRRRYKAEYLHFLTYAKASLDETEEQLQYIRDCHPDIPDAVGSLQTADASGRPLSRFLALVGASQRT